MNQSSKKSAYKVFGQPATGAKAKELEKARNACRNALRAKANDAEGMHILGLIECQLGNIAAGRQWFKKALTFQPKAADMHYHYALALMEEGDFAEAVSALKQAVALAPNHADALYRLACMLCETGQSAEAVPVYQRVVTLKPDFVEALNSYGNLLFNLGKPQEAIGCYQRALTARPTYVMAYNNMGLALASIGALDAAEQHYRRALELKPDYPEALNNLGIVYAQRNKFDEAFACYKKALALRPDYSEAHNNFGNALKECGQLDEAIEHYNAALRSKNSPDYVHNLALVQLALGDFDKGWHGYEARWQTQQLADAFRNFPQPQWKGEPAEGRTLLIHAEQGFGDTLQFCRYAPLAKARGFKVVLEVPPALKKIISSLAGVDQVIAKGQVLPPFDLHCPMMSLPLAFGTQLDTIPAATPYLHADQQAVELWKKRLPDSGGKPRIGLVWAGRGRVNSPDLVAANSRRSLNPELLAPLLEFSGAQFYSLQKDGPRAPESFELIDYMADCHDFADTAALIANLDLVISVDTAVVHLAGALGKPVWVMNRFTGCWRWLQKREDSPWYPQLRLFRQTTQASWSEVIAQLKTVISANNSNLPLHRGDSEAL